MYRMFRLFFLAMFFCGAVFAQGKGKGNNKSSGGGGNIGRWELVGKKSVSRSKEWDSFNPGGYGIFSAFKLKVTSADVDFDRMQIVYDNGRVQEVALNRVIRAGGESRVIDVVGDRRRVRTVKFRYNTKGIFNGRAEVQVWGRK